MRLTSTKIVRGIMIPAVTLAIALVVGESLRSPFGHTDRLDTTEHVIMGHPFEVPKAYLILREQWVPSEMGPGNSILMNGLLPNIDPYSEQTAQFWEGVDHYLKFVDSSLKGIIYGTGLWEDYFQAEFLSRCSPGPLDFLNCEDPLSIDFKSHEILVKIKEEKKIGLVCSRSGAHINEFCEGFFPLIDNIKLSIRFGKKHLARAEAIIARVYELVCRFYQPGRRAVTYNHCETGVYHGKTGT